MPATGELRREIYETWNEMAPTWERRRGYIEEVAAPVRDWMVSELAPRAGETVLELAAGAGDTGFEVARILGADGRLICSDLSPAMVDAARRRGHELGLDNVDYRVVDAERIDLDDDSVDGVLCRYGYMLMADRVAALSETRRVLRRGGRLVLTVWGPPERNPFFALVAMNLIRRGHMAPPDPERPGIFSMADEERTTALLEAVGLDEVRIEEVPGRFSFDDVDEHLGFVADTAGPLAAVLRGLPDEERTAIKAGLEEACAPFATGGGYALPCVTLAAVARRAAR